METISHCGELSIAVSEPPVNSLSLSEYADELKESLKRDTVATGSTNTAQCHTNVSTPVGPYNYYTSVFNTAYTEYIWECQFRN